MVKCPMDEPLVVYKALKMYVGTGQLCSPYMFYGWKIGEERSDPFLSFFEGEDKPLLTQETDMLGNTHTVINGGGFHSFDSESDAREECRYLKAGDDPRLLRNYKYVVAKCEIPSDSKFVYAGFYDIRKSYVSEKLKIVEICA